jgi:hypothetical protein
LSRRAGVASTRTRYGLLFSPISTHDSRAPLTVRVFVSIITTVIAVAPVLTG